MMDEAAGKWFVYRVNVDGKLAYIGKGCGRRWLVSAKRIGGIAGVIRFFRKETDAIKQERLLIALHKPPANKTAGGEGRSKYRADRDSMIERAWIKDAYAKEDSGWWLDRLAAICFRKCEGHAPSNGEAKWLNRLKKELMHSGGDLNLRLQSVES